MRIKSGPGSKEQKIQEKDKKKSKRRRERETEGSVTRLKDRCWMERDNNRNKDKKVKKEMEG